MILAQGKEPARYREKLTAISGVIYSIKIKPNAFGHSAGNTARLKTLELVRLESLLELLGWCSNCFL